MLFKINCTFAFRNFPKGKLSEKIRLSLKLQSPVRNDKEIEKRQLTKFVNSHSMSGNCHVFYAVTSLYFHPITFHDGNKKKNLDRVRFCDALWLFFFFLKLFFTKYRLQATGTDCNKLIRNYKLAGFKSFKGEIFSKMAKIHSIHERVR